MTRFNSGAASSSCAPLLERYSCEHAMRAVKGGNNDSRARHAAA